MKIIPYGRQHITDEDIKAVTQALQSDYLTQGPLVQAFEEKFADYVDAKYAVAVSNGTTALHLAAKVLDTKKGSRVITSPLTFAATANCIEYCGGEVQFCDIDPETLLLDINSVRKLLESHPAGSFSGIIPVSFAGYPVDLEAFRALADEHGLWLIEDACHAPGARFLNTRGNWQATGSGRYADLTIFSFHPVKHIACGEGGMITCNDPQLYQRLLTLRSHGITKDPARLQQRHGDWYYEMQELGFNYRLTDISSALGISQLDRAHSGIQKRRAIAKIYDQAFAGSEIKCIKVPPIIEHAFHLYVIQVADRLGLYNYLKDNGIGVQVHYLPVHLMPYYQAKGWQAGDFPAAENYYQHCLSIPMFPTLTREEQDIIINLIKSFYHEKTCHNSSKRREQEAPSKEYKKLHGATYHSLPS